MKFSVDVVVIDNSENLVVAVIIIISLRRLIEGGALILVMVKISHHMVRVGVILSIPFIRNILRVCRVS